MSKPLSLAILIMGVCGTGKTTLGRKLAEILAVTFLDADDFHPEKNRQKMADGIPLNDADRTPWLVAMSERISQGDDVILACSALKESYRAILLAARPELRVIFLNAARDVLYQRLTNRANHFMPASLLDSQLEILVAPADALVIDTAQPMESSLQKMRSFAQKNTP